MVTRNQKQHSWFSKVYWSAFHQNNVTNFSIIQDVLFELSVPSGSLQKRNFTFMDAKEKIHRITIRFLESNKTWLIRYGNDSDCHLQELSAYRDILETWGSKGFWRVDTTKKLLQSHPCIFCQMRAWLQPHEHNCFQTRSRIYIPHLMLVCLHFCIPTYTILWICH